MARRKQDLARTRQKKLARRKERERYGRESAPIAKLSRKLGERLDEAYALIRRGNYASAEELLEKLDSRGTSYPEIVEAILFLYQTTGDHERSCQAAERLAKLLPRDPEARLMVAQESMFCGRVATAQLNYQQFIEQWPDHPHVTKAKRAMELLVPETEDRIKASGFAKKNGLEWLALHEETLSLLQSGEFSACAAKCRELLAEVPTFASARNNLAIAYFQSGRAKDAVAVVEETRQLVPDNRFAETTLAKLYFLTGRPAEAHQLADQIVAAPPTQQDPLVAALEMLAFLGRDEDLVMLAEAATQEEIVDDQSRAIQYHYLAYAKCRLGDERAARAFWKKCLKIYSHHPDARENMLDLDSGDGHAPWADSCAKWIPKEAMERVIENMRDEKYAVLARYPDVASLVPALLERGDPLGREVAMRLAKADGSPPMLDALKQFALGLRGPDSMRFEALTFLKEKGAVDSGPHRVYSRGEWTDIQLFAAEISNEPAHSAASPRVLELVIAGIEATRTGNYAFAEARLQAALEEEPNNCSAVYNLCVIWLRRDGRVGEKRARTRLQQLQQNSPDYPFAAIALSQFAAMDGDFQRARDLLAPIFLAKKLHVSEAMSLFTAQVQIALAERDLEGAERAFELLCQFSDESDVNVRELRRRIDRASKKSGLRSLFSMLS